MGQQTTPSQGSSVPLSQDLVSAPLLERLRHEKTTWAGMFRGKAMSDLEREIKVGSLVTVLCWRQGQQESLSWLLRKYIKNILWAWDGYHGSTRAVPQWLLLFTDMLFLSCWTRGFLCVPGEAPLAERSSRIFALTCARVSDRGPVVVSYLVVRSGRKEAVNIKFRGMSRQWVGQNSYLLSLGQDTHINSESRKILEIHERRVWKVPRLCSYLVA